MTDTDLILRCNSCPYKVRKDQSNRGLHILLVFCALTIPKSQLLWLLSYHHVPECGFTLLCFSPLSRSVIREVTLPFETKIQLTIALIFLFPGKSSSLPMSYFLCSVSGLKLFSSKLCIIFVSHYIVIFLFSVWICFCSFSMDFLQTLRLVCVKENRDFSL